MRHPLEVALRAEGIAYRVEARERLALLIPDAGSPLLTTGVRQRTEVLARQAGFTHVALEVGTDGAPVPRD